MYVYDGQISENSIDEFRIVFDDAEPEAPWGVNKHHKLQKQKLFPKNNLPDEFYAKFGIEEGGEAAFREEVRNNMQRELEGAQKNQVKQQVMDSLAELHEFAVPANIVHREIHVLKDQMMSQFQLPQGGDQTNLPSLPDELFHDQAQKQARINVVRALASSSLLHHHRHHA